LSRLGPKANTNRPRDAGMLRASTLSACCDHAFLSTSERADRAANVGIEEAVPFYEATFGAMVCIVRVEARADGQGKTRFVATPFLHIDGQDALYWFPNEADEPSEIDAGTEEEALAQATTFLTDRFGHQNARFTKTQARPFPLKPLGRRST
jgi:hypothetical protein